MKTATKKTKVKTLALTCKCGDCASWEILHVGAQTILKCVSCGGTHEVAFSIDPHEHLHYKAV